MKRDLAYPGWGSDTASLSSIIVTARSFITHLLLYVCPYSLLYGVKILLKISEKHADTLIDNSDKKKVYSSHLVKTILVETKPAIVSQHLVFTTSTACSLPMLFY